MPKADLQRVINSRTNGRMHASSAGAIYSGDGMADTVDGFDASKQPGPSLIPVALSDGKLDPGWLPEQAASGEGASATGGQVYVAPWVRLARAISDTDTTIYLNGNIHAVGDQAVLGHYRYGNEGITITGGPVEQGTLYEYTVTRAATSRAYPAGSTVVFNLGGANDGGFITMVSGDQQQALVGPHLNMFAYEDGAAVRKVRIGRLQGLSTAEKAQFPKVDDWNVYGLYADAAYLRGQIVADSGDIAGDLDVGGTLGVWSGLGRAGVVLGNSEGGHGITLQNREGRPVFGAVSPYEDASGVLSDVAVWIENKGEKGLYYHLDPTTGEYQLEIGVNTLVDGTLTAANILAGTGAYPSAFTGMRFGAEGLQSYGTDFLPQIELDIQNGYFYFGGREGWLYEKGIAIDTRGLVQGLDELEHTIHWIHQTNRTADGGFIGASLGSMAGQLFATARRYLTDLDTGDLGAQAIDTFYEAQLWLEPGEQNTSYLYGQNVELRGDLTTKLAAGAATATLTPDGRFSTDRLTVGGAALHVTDDKQTVSIGTNSASGARLISQSDTVAAFRGQRSDGQYIALTPTATAESWISASGAIVLAPNIGQTARAVLPAAASVTLGTAARPFGDVFATRLHGTVGSQVAIADNSSLYLTQQTMTFGVNLEAENVLAYATQSDLPVGAFFRFEDVDGNIETIRINTVGAVAGDWYEYEVERAQATGETALLWYAGTVGVSLGGNATDGYVRLFGTDDLNPATGPSIVIYQRENDDVPESVSERAVFGNLSGWYHYADNADLYGVAFGRKTGAWASMDEANGLRMFWNETQLAQYGEAIDIGQPDAAHLHIDADDVTLYAGATPTIELLGTGDANITGTLAVASGGVIMWAGGKGQLDNNGIDYDIDGANYFRIASGTPFLVEIQSGGMGATFEALQVYSADGIAISAEAGAGATALQIVGGIVDGGSQRYTAMADATADTDGLNRQTGDARYAPIGSSSQTWRTWFGA